MANEREAFERWAAHKTPADLARNTSRPNSLYAQFEAEIMWQAWQAASAGKSDLLAALKIANKHPGDPAMWLDQASAAIAKAEAA